MLARPEARVRDAGVDAPESCAARGERRTHVGRTRDVRTDAQGALAPGPRRNVALELVEAPVTGRDDARTLLREHLEERAPDAAGCAGDEHDLPCESEVHDAQCLALSTKALNAVSSASPR